MIMLAARKNRRLVALRRSIVWTHLSLEKDAPEPRRVESPAMGKVSAIPKVGGLHHYYTRHAAA